MEFIRKNKVFLGKCTDENSATITEITVPEGFTYIDREAFVDFPNLKRLVLPKSITGFNDGAFLGCRSLSEIVMPGVTEMYKNDYSDCVSLKTIYVPKGIKSLRDFCFWSMKNLKKIVFLGLDRFEFFQFSAFATQKEVKIILPTESEKPIVEYKQEFGTYELDEKFKKRLYGRTPMEQAQEYALEEHSYPTYNGHRSPWPRPISFIEWFVKVKAFIMDEGLLVGFILRGRDDNHKASDRPILVGQTTAFSFDRHEDMSGDNNGAGYKNDGQASYSRNYMTLIPY